MMPKIVIIFVLNYVCNFSHLYALTSWQSKKNWKFIHRYIDKTWLIIPSSQGICNLQHKLDKHFNSIFSIDQNKHINKHSKWYIKCIGWCWSWSWLGINVSWSDRWQWKTFIQEAALLYSAKFVHVLILCGGN